MILILVLIILIIVPLVIALLRTLLLRKQKTNQEGVSAPFLEHDAVKKLQHAISFKTVVNKEGTTDWQQFTLFEAFLDEAFPLCAQHLKIPSDSQYNLIYRFVGEDTAKLPALLTAHQDVVSAKEDEWTYPPFTGTLADNYLWGRGSFDCKLQLIAILETFEQMLQQGTKPKRTWYAAFGSDEEVNGGVQGATLIAEQFARMGLSFSLLLDEGGVVSENYIKGINDPIAVVGITEKGYMDTVITAQSESGHSSTPKMPTALGKVAQAASRLETTRHKPRFTEAVEAMLTNIGKRAPFPYAFLFLNLWLTKPLVQFVFSKSPTLNALIRTTSVPTMIEASDKSNVIAQSASMVVNSRILSGDDQSSVLAHFDTVLADLDVTYSVLRYERPSQTSSPSAAAFEVIQSTITSVFPSAIVTSYVMLGATDARKYEDLCQNIYRFTPAQMDRLEVQRMHGPDERIHTENVTKAVTFFHTLLQNW